MRQIIRRPAPDRTALPAWILPPRFATLLAEGGPGMKQRRTVTHPERVLAYCKDRGLFDVNAMSIQDLIEDNPELSLDFEDIGEYDAFIEKVDENRYRIVINRKHSLTRRRFSMAHEYAHYQIHRHEIKDMPRGERILHRSEERDTIE